MTGWTVLIRISPRVEWDFAFKIRAVPAGAKRRIGRRDDEESETFFDRGIAADVEPHRIERGLQHPNLGLGRYHLRALKPFAKTRPDQRAQ